jgi:hypothetical protein
MPKGTLRTCKYGHKYYKSSDCPVCPICESEKTPEQEFLQKLSAPARRALENAGINTLTQLSRHSESDVIKLHGMGPSSLPKLRASLKKEGKGFKG